MELENTALADRTMDDPEDVARAKYVMDNFDHAYLSKSKAQGYTTKDGKTAPIVIFDKKIDGTHVIVEAVCDAKKRKNFLISEYISSVGVPPKK